MKLQRKMLEAVLFDGVWVYGPADLDKGRWGKMMFLRDGRTFGYGHPHEYGWDFVPDGFRFLQKDGEPTSIFKEVSTENGRMVLHGGPVLDPGSTYILEQAEPPKLPKI
jgi:hypothetical protein